MKHAAPMLQPARISAKRLAIIRSLWELRRCYVCDCFGFCPHRELRVELAEFGAAAALYAETHEHTQTRT